MFFDTDKKGINATKTIKKSCSKDTNKNFNNSSNIIINKCCSYN